MSSRERISELGIEQPTTPLILGTSPLSSDSWTSCFENAEIVKQGTRGQIFDLIGHATNMCSTWTNQVQWNHGHKYCSTKFMAPTLPMVSVGRLKYITYKWEKNPYNNGKHLDDTHCTAHKKTWS